VPSLLNNILKSIATWTVDVAMWALSEKPKKKEGWFALHHVPHVASLYTMTLVLIICASLHTQDNNVVNPTKRGPRVVFQGGKF